MPSFEEDFNKRLRRLVGIEDDSVDVYLNYGVGEGHWSGGCETCAFWIDGEPFVTIVRDVEKTAYSHFDGSTYTYTETESLLEFNDLGEIVRALSEVEF